MRRSAKASLTAACRSRSRVSASSAEPAVIAVAAVFTRTPSDFPLPFFISQTNLPLPSCQPQWKAVVKHGDRM